MQSLAVKRASLAAVAALTLGLSACANIPASYRTQGQVGGGVVGGLVGNALCGGVLCTVAGALGGAYVGDRLVANGTIGEHRVATGPAYGPTQPYAYETSVGAPVRPLHYTHHLRHRHVKHHLRHHHHRAY